MFVNAATSSRKPAARGIRVSNAQRGVPVLRRTGICKSAMSTDSSSVEGATEIDFMDLPGAFVSDLLPELRPDRSPELRPDRT